MARSSGNASRQSVRLPDSTDVDAFEFIACKEKDKESPHYGKHLLMVIFSVDQDDTLTANVDESGGLKPGAIYGSYLNGAHFEIVDLDQGDIDALTTFPNPTQYAAPIGSVTLSLLAAATAAFAGYGLVRRRIKRRA